MKARRMLVIVGVALGVAAGALLVMRWLPVGAQAGLGGVVVAAAVVVIIGLGLSRTGQLGGTKKTGEAAAAGVE